MHTIWPAPITPSFFTSAAAPTEGVELKARHCCLAAHRAACLEATENIAIVYTNYNGIEVKVLGVNSKLF